MSTLAYPLQWPAGWQRTSPGARQPGQFKGGTVTSCVKDLREEVDRLLFGKESRVYTYRALVISSNVPLRRDGHPNGSAAEPGDPGVAIYFERKKKPVCFACDQYNRVWKNLRALAHTLEAMRGIERWGSSSLLERAFTGFAALPAPSSRSVWDLLELPADGADEDAVMAAYRRLAKSAHPDAPGGSHDSFASLSQAKDVALATIKSRRGGV